MTKVYVKKLDAPHQSESLTKFMPLNDEMKAAVNKGVKEIFDAAGGSAMLKSSKDVYIKPNGIDGKSYCFTRPELVEAAVKYWFDAGARNVYLFENSTQSNFTRLVFEVIGYSKICRETGAKPIYLDEEKNVVFEFKGKAPVAQDKEGYTGTTFEMPKIIVDKLIKHKDKNLYISLPKLKTHSMAGVTLGVKNQWAFPKHNDRRADHNYNLPYKLVDVLSYLRPDFTIIEGVEGTIYGHYPVTSLADKCVIPFKLLIGGANVVATDMVGSKIFGLELEDVPHLKIAVEKGLGDGVKGLSDIEIIGDISEYKTQYPTDLYDAFPADVNIIRGTELLCREGCQNNPLTLLQVLSNDYNGKGGWNMVIGKGHDPNVIDNLKGPVLIVGHCAIDEVSERLIKRLGKNKVYLSGECNDLAASLAAMSHLMKVNPLVFVPLPFAKTAKLFTLATLHGTKANVPSPFAHIMKTV